MSRPEVNRRDLLRCLDAGVPSWIAAKLCAFDFGESEKPEAPPVVPLSERLMLQAAEAPAPVKEELLLTAAVRASIRPEGFEGSLAAPNNDAAEQPVPFTEKELAVQYGPPGIEPLMPWSRLWPYLHRVLGVSKPGLRLDVKAAVRLVATSRFVDRLPRRKIQRWARRIRVIVDESLPRGFIDDDVDLLLRELTRLRGGQGLLIEKVTKKTLPGLPARALPTLVISDLGQLGRDKGLMDEWLLLANRLADRGVTPIALAPCPRDRWDPFLAVKWRCACWDRHAQLPPPGKGLEPVVDVEAGEKAARRAEQLLALLSPTLLVEPALMRALRCLLSPPFQDVGAEYDVRVGSSTTSAGRDLAMLPQAAAVGVRKFETGFDAALKKAAAEVVIAHHGGYGPALLSREILSLAELGAPLSLSLVEKAEELQRRINSTMLRDLDAAVEIGLRLGLFQWREWETPRLSPSALATPEAARGFVFASRFYGRKVERIPEEMNQDYVREAAALALPDPGRVTKWLVRRRNDLLELRPWEPYTLSPPARLLVGQSAALIHLRRLHVQLTIERGSAYSRQSLLLVPNQTHEIQIGPFDTLRIEGDCGAVDLAKIPGPLRQTEGPQRISYGWDQYGLYAELKVSNIAFKLRYIPPGTFEMGSPEDEPGRFDREGPVHRVSIAEGFWMAETPVTQGQYRAVTGENPSHFKSAGDHAPVEQVDWNQARSFCERLNKELTELAQGERFRLPSEAEWEYACRAGTTTALYTGPITIVGERNAPELEAIAWYGGNSGVDYPEGYDSSQWPEKQTDHKKAGSHPVKGKAANPWGLHDMLGNVYEWCEDHWHDTYNDAPGDGSPWLDSEGRGRVFRGGGWYVNAQWCRAAYRYRFVPGSRDIFLGFRLVLSRSSAVSLEQGRHRPEGGQVRGERSAVAVPRAEPGPKRQTDGPIAEKGEIAESSDGAKKERKGWFSRWRKK